MLPIWQRAVTYLSAFPFFVAFVVNDQVVPLALPLAFFATTRQ